MAAALTLISVVAFQPFGASPVNAPAAAEVTDEDVIVKVDVSVIVVVKDTVK